MRVSLHDLEVFSRCPARVEFGKTRKVPHNLELDIVDSVIKKCHLQATETGYRADWRRIVSWVDKMSFKDIEVYDPDSYEVGKRTSEHCLVFLRTWYEALYLVEDVIAYVDIALDMKVGRHIIHNTIPVIKSDGTSIQILQTSDIPRGNKHLFNSIEARGMALLLSSHLTEDRISVLSIAIGKKGGFKVAEIKTKIEDHARMKQRLAALTEAFSRGYNYPSVGEQCYSCPFRWRCIL